MANWTHTPKYPHPLLKKGLAPGAARSTRRELAAIRGFVRKSNSAQNPKMALELIFACGHCCYRVGACQ